MSIDRRNAIVAGALLLLGFSGVFIAVFTGPVLAHPQYLAQAAAQANDVTWGAFFQLLMAFACAGIAIFLYPALRRHNEALALGAVGFRLIEAVLFVLAAVVLLCLPGLGREYVNAGSPAASHFQTTGALLRSAGEWANLAGLFAWCLGALMYHWVFFQSKLIPRWLSLWGLLGVPFALAACLLVLFGIITDESPVHTALNLPLGLQEIPLALWLIVKGFRPAALTEPATSPAA